MLRFSIETEAGLEFELEKDVLIPLAQGCETVMDGWQKHKPEIIKSLAVMYRDLRDKYSALESTVASLLERSEEREKRLTHLPLLDAFRTVDWKRIREEIAGLSFLNRLQLTVVKA